MNDEIKRLLAQRAKSLAKITYLLGHIHNILGSLLAEVQTAESQEVHRCNCCKPEDRE